MVTNEYLDLPGLCYLENHVGFLLFSTPFTSFIASVVAVEPKRNALGKERPPLGDGVACPVMEERADKERHMFNTLSLVVTAE